MSATHSWNANISSHKMVHKFFPGVPFVPLVPFRSVPGFTNTLYLLCQTVNSCCTFPPPLSACIVLILSTELVCVSTEVTANRHFVNYYIDALSLNSAVCETNICISITVEKKNCMKKLQNHSLHKVTTKYE